MRRQNRRELRPFFRPGRNSRTGISLSDSADYWPLTVVPSTSRPKRSTSTWILLSAIVALGAGLLFAIQRNISAW
jgi:hypothetical protein